MARLLIIEDEALVRDNLVRFLKLEGHTVVEAMHGEEGLALASQPGHGFDMILCDVMMPRLDGFGVLAALQQGNLLGNIPFVFLSASAEPERLEEALKRGASAYVTKPFHLQQLRNLLTRFLPEQNPPTEGQP